MSNMKVLGNTDEVTTCDCCGRKELKGTVALESDDGEVVYYGVVCASKASNRPAKGIRYDARIADEAKRAKERTEAHGRHLAEMAKWEAFLESSCQGKVKPQYDGKQDVFSQIQFLGGYVKARNLFDQSEVK